MEGIQGITMALGIDARFNDGKLNTAEERANLCEEIFSIPHIDKNLNAITHGTDARLHHWDVALNAMIEHARVPGHFARIVSQEIGDIQLLPEFLVRAVGHGVQAQFFQGRFLARLQAMTAGIGVPTEMKQKLEEMQRQNKAEKANLDNFDDLDFNVYSNQKWHELGRSHAKVIGLSTARQEILKADSVRV